MAPCWITDDSEGPPPLLDTSDTLCDSSTDMPPSLVASSSDEADSDVPPSLEGSDDDSDNPPPLQSEVHDSIHGDIRFYDEDHVSEWLFVLPILKILMTIPMTTAVL